MNKDSVVIVKNLVKKFGDNTALNDISLDIEDNKIVGLIGPDGAGKTTFIRSLLGLLLPTSGTISILGLNPSENVDELHKVIGYMPQKFGLYEDLTVIENLNLYADLKNVVGQDRVESFKMLLDFTSLEPFKDRLAGNLSGGMKQKLGLACALLGKPKFLLLDEPGVGVDPISRRELMKMVRNLSADMTILWSTSYLDEAENFDEVILFNEGKLIYKGVPSLLTEKMVGNVFLAKKDGVKNRTLLKEFLVSGDKIVDVVIEGESVRVVIKDENVKQKYSDILKPVKPRFEDAVIDILGGTPLGESLIAKNLKIDECDCEYMIDAGHLTKVYGGNFYASNDITFRVKRGEIFGLLGPNGAGKSTTFKMMCGLSRPTSGKALIRGIDMAKSSSLARSYLGYMAQKFSLFSTLSVLANLKFFAGIYGLKGKEKNEKIKQMVDIFALSSYLDFPAGDLPLGFKQRLALACAIMHNPAILFLDEPTSGVDPITRREFWKHINAMVEKGVSVVVTTHFMDEAEYCDNIALIYGGRAIKIGPTSEIKLKGETMEDAFVRIILENDKKKAERLK